MKKGKHISVREIPGYEKLARELEMHDISIDDKCITMGRKMIPVLDSYVNVEEEYSCFFVLMPIGEKMIAWDVIKIFNDLEEKQGAWFSAWKSEHQADVKWCFTLRANGIGIDEDTSDPWYPVLRDTEMAVYLVAEDEYLSIVEYIKWLFEEFDRLFNLTMEES